MKYSKTYLKGVQFIAKFEKPRFEFDEDTKSGDFELLHNKILSKYPVISIKNRRDRNINVTDDNSTIETREGKVHIYSDKNNEKMLIVNPRQIEINYKNYKNYSELEKDISEIAKSFYDTIKSKFITLELRYVNMIEITENDPLDWKDYIAEKLISPFEFVPEKDNLSRLFNDIELNYDDMNLSFQYGMYNPDFPSKIRRKLFVLDYSGYSNKLFNNEEIEDQLKKMHKKIKSLFEASIKDGLRNKMK